mmetsp:Transcript_19896/g.61568  ORF Transcript_19896/g.61568 Transcript_19896/m.61568 type:complete len:205 (-) Transcript_19896:381-995(-)
MNHREFRRMAAAGRGSRRRTSLAASMARRESSAAASTRARAASRTRRWRLRAPWSVSASGESTQRASKAATRAWRRSRGRLRRPWTSRKTRPSCPDRKARARLPARLATFGESSATSSASLVSLSWPRHVATQRAGSRSPTSSKKVPSHDSGSGGPDASAAAHSDASRCPKASARDTSASPRRAYSDATAASPPSFSAEDNSSS